MDRKVLHNILLKRAKKASYKAFELEEINHKFETYLIDFYLDREVLNKLKDITINEEEIEKYYETNKKELIVEPKAKFDLIFFKDKVLAESVLKEINIKNFYELRKKYNEGADETSESISNYIPLSRITTPIAEAILKATKKGIQKKLIDVQEGYCILYLKEKEESHIAELDEIKEFIINEIKKQTYAKFYNEIIDDILNEEARIEGQDNLESEENN